MGKRRIAKNRAAGMTKEVSFEAVSHRGPNAEFSLGPGAGSQIQTSVQRRHPIPGGRVPAPADCQSSPDAGWRWITLATRPARSARSCRQPRDQCAAARWWPTPIPVLAPPHAPAGVRSFPLRAVDLASSALVGAGSAPERQSGPRRHGALHFSARYCEALTPTASGWSSPSIVGTSSETVG